MKTFARSLVLAFATLLSFNAWAGDKVSVSFIKNPGCAGVCGIDALKSGALTIAPSKAVGSTGLVFKAKLSGLSLAGTKLEALVCDPFGGPGESHCSQLHIYLSVNGGSCMEYFSPNVTVVKGTAKATFTAAELTPVLSASAGAAVSPCGQGNGSNPVALYELEVSEIPGLYLPVAVAGVNTGS